MNKMLLQLFGLVHVFIFPSIPFRIMLLSHLYTVRCVDQYYRTRYVTYVLYLIQVYVCGLQFEIKIDEISIKFYCYHKFIFFLWNCFEISNKHGFCWWLYLKSYGSILNKLNKILIIWIITKLSLRSLCWFKSLKRFFF